MHNHEQINDLLQRNVALVLSQKMEVPLEYFITITRADCATDLKTAKIFISVLPFNKGEAGLTWIIRNKGLLQKELGRVFKRKYTPILHFELDKSEQTASEIYQAIDQANKE